MTCSTVNFVWEIVIFFARSRKNLLLPKPTSYKGTIIPRSYCSYHRRPYQYWTVVFSTTGIRSSSNYWCLHPETPFYVRLNSLLYYCYTTHFCDRHTDARVKVRIICRQEDRKAKGCRKGRRK